MNKSQILYVTDPLCLWCYGMAPDLEDFYANLSSDIECVTINGGLFPSNKARVADNFFRNYLKKAAAQVTEYTGQIFGDPFWKLLETPGFNYDTEPSAKASVAVKKLRDDVSMRAFIHQLQRAVFIEGKNPNEENILADIAEQQGINREDFLFLFNSDDNTKETHNEYIQALEMGVKGFPALIYIHEEKGYGLAAGYSPKDQLFDTLNWARSQAGQKPIAIAEDSIASTDTNKLSCSADGCTVS